MKRVLKDHASPVSHVAGADRWLSTRKGRGALQQLLHTCYDLQPTLHAADYLNAAYQLMTRQRKRALIVMLSNLRDEDATELLPALDLLRQRHLVIFANLRETPLDGALRAEVDDLPQALLRASASRYLRARAIAQERLRRSGALVVDATPQQLPVALINQYLQIKRNGRL